MLFPTFGQLMWRGGVIGLLGLITAVVQFHPSAAWHAQTQVVDPPGLQLVPRTDGATVIWLDNRSGDLGNADLYGLRLGDGQEFPIATGALDLAHADIDAGVVVWAEAPCAGCPRDIVGMRLATGERFALTDSPDEDDGLTAISGRWVVWISTGEDGQAWLRARDITAMAQAVDLATVSGVGYRPVIDGDRIVWEDLDVDGGWALYTMRLDDSSPTLLARSEPVPTGAGGSFGYDVAGDIAVYMDSRDYGGEFHLMVINVSTGAQKTIATGLFNQQPTTDGRYIIWEDRRFPEDPDGQHADLVGYDLQTDSAFLVATGSARNERPDLDGGMLVWSHGNDIDSAIHASQLLEVLPTAPRAAPGTSSPDWRFFRETGHYLSAGFRAYWEANGELPVFGYPLTEEFEELNADTGAFHSTQYFERQRFEWHPENAGSQYEVLLGRLGAELLSDQDRDWTTFPTADPQTPYYFPETRHAIAPEFWAFWSDHGLELDDEGVSHRESTALFGLPLSEPMMETNGDGDTVLTQYFERAVFEFHPDNPEPYRVLLRRLGAEALIARGW